MRILGTTSSASVAALNYSVLSAPTTQPDTAIYNGATVASGFMSGNGYYVKYGAPTSSLTQTGSISYATSINGPWTYKTIQSQGQARGINYIDTGSNKYWVYGNDSTGQFSYTSDGTPQGTLSTVSPVSSGATSAAMIVYCDGAPRPFVAVGANATGVYVSTATSISGSWTTITLPQSSAGVQGIAWGGTGTGSDKRLIMVLGGNAAGATYFSAANDTSSYTLQTVTGGDCRGLAYTGTHWLYHGDNTFGRAAASSFSNTTGNAITYANNGISLGTRRGLAAAPNGSGIVYASGGGAAFYSTDHGASFASVTGVSGLASQVKMHIGNDTIVAYSNSDASIAYLTYV
jgi:hypothetical protein